MHRASPTFSGSGGMRWPLSTKQCVSGQSSQASSVLRAVVRVGKEWGAEGEKWEGSEMREASLGDGTRRENCPGESVGEGETVWSMLVPMCESGALVARMTPLELPGRVYRFAHLPTASC